MSVSSNTPSVIAAKDDVTTFLRDEFIHEIWVSLAGQVTHEHIFQIATEVASEYKDAKITTFLPILIRRQTLERLKPTNQDGRANH